MYFLHVLETSSMIMIMIMIMIWWQDYSLLQPFANLGNEKVQNVCPSLGLFHGILCFIVQTPNSWKHKHAVLKRKVHLSRIKPNWKSFKPVSYNNLWLVVYIGLKTTEILPSTVYFNNSAKTQSENICACENWKEALFWLENDRRPGNKNWKRVS